MAGFWGWLTAQVAKIFTCYFKKGIWDVTQVVSSGGMPSSHSSLCMVRSLSASCYPGKTCPRVVQQKNRAESWVHAH